MPNPNTNTPLVDPKTGIVTGEWLSFFHALGRPAGAAKAITPTESPFTYTASSNGALVLNSAVSGLQLIRGRETIVLPPAPGVIPMASGDRLYVNYGVGAPPAMTFLPS